MADSLDSIVKGAPAPGQDLPNPVVGTSPIASSSTGKTGDPLSHTPSSPSMIYLNLLILEASLRAQYLELRARRRHHTFFLSILSLWTVGFGYALFLAPREDGSGVGGSVYWMVETTERMCFLGGVITAMLVWATGIWERGVRWPRRWFTVSNRGLRAFNCKLVVMKRPWWKEALATTGWFLTYGLFSNSGGSSYRYVDPTVLREVDKELNLTKVNHPTLLVTNGDEEKGGHDEDLASGGDYVKLLLLAKPFSPTFRENWELYRTEYWERENERRALLRVKLKERDQRMRREDGGWFWWLPWRRASEKPQLVRADSEKVAHHHPRHAAVLGEHRRTRSNSTRRASMSTGTGSRSSTPAPTPVIEVDEAGVTRKASTASNASDKRRKKLSVAGSKNRPRVESRSVTPDNPSPLGRESSFGSSRGSPGSPNT